MRSRVIRAVYAGVLATISVAALFAPPSLERLRWLLTPLAVPAIPAHLVTFGLGLGGGPESLPYYTDPAMYVLTFPVWWAILEGVHKVRSWRRTKSPAYISEAVPFV
jgi:hypothetical protein